MMMNRGLFGTGAILLALVAGSPSVVAQTLPAIVDCQPPAANEFLLFAVTRTPDAQSVLRSKAPTDATTVVCRYQGDVVTRVGGFGSEPSAAAWGQYLIRSTGIPTTIVRPAPVAVAPEAIPTVKASPSTGSGAVGSGSAGSGSVGKRFAPGVYKPQALSSGYAVLVNYNNRPEVAVQLGQVLNQAIGVAAYGERPYLYVMQTGEMSAANAVVKLLNDRGFLAMRVEAKSVVLLRTLPIVAPNP
jgi:hypothetical protein